MQHANNTYNLTSGLPVDAAQCLYNIGKAGHNDYSGMINQAYDRGNSRIKELIDTKYKQKTHNGGIWLAFKNEAMALIYNNAFLEEIHKAFTTEVRKQGKDNCAQYIEKQNHVPAAVQACYTDAGKNDNDKDTIKQAFITSWIGGLTPSNSTENLAVQYRKSILTTNPMTWESVQMTAQAAEDTKQAQGRQHNTRHPTTDDDSHRTTSSHQRNKDELRYLTRQHEERRRQNNQKDQDDHNRRQQEANRDHDRRRQAITASATAMDSRRRQSLAATQDMLDTMANQTWSNAHNIAPQMSAGPRPNYSPGPPPGRPPQQNPRADERTMAMARTGVCFQCGGRGHLKSHCTLNCPHCGKRPTNNQHARGCRLHPANIEATVAATTKGTGSRAGNGRARR